MSIACGSYIVKVKCSECGKKLHTTRNFSYSELCSVWDRMVLSFSGLPCKCCGQKTPNFHLDIVLRDQVSKCNYLPSEVIKRDESYTIEDLMFDVGSSMKPSDYVKCSTEFEEVEVL